MSYVRIAVVAALTAVATVLLGWWSVAAIGLASGLMPGAARRAGIEAGAGAALGWAALLGWTAVQGPLWVLAARVGDVFGLPAVGLVAIGLLFPALLAASAAELASAVRR